MQAARSGGLTKGMMMTTRGSALLLLLACSLTATAEDFKLNAQQYFERPGVNVMYGQDYYPEGHQGGLSIIMLDERSASNGDVRLEPSRGGRAFPSFIFSVTLAPK